MPACFAGYYALRHVPDTCMPLHLAVLCDLGALQLRTNNRCAAKLQCWADDAP
jgi:hypothetical protein